MAKPDLHDKARRLLHRHWGHAGFREGQWETIEAVLAGRDALTIFPTGGGKSICYQVPALMREGMTLVVSPLIALMQDQVAGLHARGIPATYVNSTLSSREIDQRFNDAEFGRYRLLYLAPERLESDLFKARAERLGVGLLAVDEAHCVSTWGRHFRPAYQRIPEARTLLGDPPTIALTATATPEVRRDVREKLALRDPFQLVSGFDRPNVVWSVFRTANKKAHLERVVGRVPGTGLVYVATRNRAVQWAAWLERQGVAAEAYHAGMPHGDRKRVQERWIAGKTRVVVATNAFGMGIDKPDVRFVVHVDLPISLEDYYQEAGRAGRDGDRSYAVLLYRDTDEELPRSLIAGGHPDAQTVRRVYTAAANLGQIPLGVLPDGPVHVDEEAVAQLADLSTAEVRASVEVLVRQGVWLRVPLRRHKGHLHFAQPAPALRAFAESCSNRALGRFVQVLLRTVHAEAFHGWWEVDLPALERRTGLTRARLLDGMVYLQQHGLLEWRPPDQALAVEFTDPRTQTVPIDDVHVRRARKRSEEQLDDMVRYARSVGCRRRFLLGYFGERVGERCGQCDVCLGRHRPVVVTGEDDPVLRALLACAERGTAPDAWPEEVDERASRVEALVDWLIQEGLLEVPGPLEQRYRVTDKARELMRQWAPRA